MESPRQKLILEEGGGAGFAEMWLAAVIGRQQACFLGHSSQRHRLGGVVSSPRRKSRTRSLREGLHQQERAEHWTLEPGHGDEMGEETG